MFGDADESGLLLALGDGADDGVVFGDAVTDGLGAAVETACRGWCGDGCGVGGSVTLTDGDALGTPVTRRADSLRLASSTIDAPGGCVRSTKFCSMRSKRATSSVCDGLSVDIASSWLS